MYIPLNPILHALKKIGTARQIFGTVPRLPVSRLPPAAPLKIYTFTRRKLGVPCLKIVSRVPKIWRAVPIFLAGETSCIARSIGMR